MKNALSACLALFLIAPPILTAEEGWNAGRASIVITPESPMWMAGYGSRKEPSQGKLTDLWAKALVLEDAEGNQGLILTLDVVGISKGLAEQACRRLEEAQGWKRHEIAICTSHTHSGPVVGRNLAPLHYLRIAPEQQELVDAYAQDLLEKLTEVAAKAREDLAPARLQWGNGKSTFAVNRRNNKPYTEVPDRRARGTLVGPVDHDVPVLSVRDAEGSLKAVLFGYACHATVLGLQQWCGDYPGYAQMKLEERFPGCTALFWAGCGGDQNPLPRRTVALAQEYGAELAEAVEEVLAAPMEKLSPRLNPQFRLIELPLAEVPTRKQLQENAKAVSPFEVARARYLLAKMEEQGSLQGHYPFPIGVWEFGDEVEWITLGGEVVVDYALRLKRERSGIRTWVAGYAHDVMAYIPSLRVLQEGGYEGDTSNVYYGLPSLWSEQVEETLIKEVHAFPGRKP